MRRLGLAAGSRGLDGVASAEAPRRRQPTARGAVTGRERGAVRVVAGAALEALSWTDSTHPFARDGGQHAVSAWSARARVGGRNGHGLRTRGGCGLRASAHRRSRHPVRCRRRPARPGRRSRGARPAPEHRHPRRHLRRARARRLHAHHAGALGGDAPRLRWQLLPGARRLRDHGLGVLRSRRHLRAHRGGAGIRLCAAEGLARGCHDAPARSLLPAPGGVATVHPGPAVGHPRAHAASRHAARDAGHRAAPARRRRPRAPACEHLQRRRSNPVRARPAAAASGAPRGGPRRGPHPHAAPRRQRRVRGARASRRPHGQPASGPDRARHPPGAVVAPPRRLRHPIRALRVLGVAHPDPRARGRRRPARPGRDPRPGLERRPGR